MKIDYDRREKKRKDYINIFFGRYGIDINKDINLFILEILLTDEFLKKMSNRKFKKALNLILNNILINQINVDELTTQGGVFDYEIF